MPTRETYIIAGDGSRQLVVEEYPVEDDNRVAIEAKLLVALEANRADITQAQAIQTQAANIENFSGAFTNTQRDANIKALAQGVRLLAQQSRLQAVELNEIIRRLLGQLDGTD